MRSEVRSEDLVGCLPGYDFAVLLPEVSGSQLTEVAGRIRSAVRTIRAELPGVDGRVEINELTVSVGGASYPEQAGSLEDLMLRADAALFLAKSYVRDQVRLVGTREPNR